MESILLVTAGAVTFAGLTFSALFRYLDPEIVRDDHHVCRGGWHEAYLNNCEEGLLKIPQQPVNTYTNLAYLAAGIYIQLSLDSLPSIVFLVTMAYLCVGSALYHATSTRWAGMLDVTGIYTVFSALAVYAAFTLTDATPALVSGAMFVGAGLAVYFLSVRFRRRMNLVIGIFLGLSYAFLILRMVTTGAWDSWRVLALSFVLFALAYLFWTLDRAKAFPLKRWGHGLWHLLTAVASTLVFYGAHLLK